MFTKELLNCWIYKACAKGSIFQDCLDTWFERTSSVNAMKNRLGKEKPVGRHQVNYACSLFLKRLCFPSPKHLTSPFSCSECEWRAKDGDLTCNTVIMDGTATGIFGELPKFARWTKAVPSVSPSIALYQYVMKTTNRRLYKDSVLLSVRKRLHSPKFFARVPIKLRRYLIRYRQAFFKSSIFTENQCEFCIHEN